MRLIVFTLPSTIEGEPHLIETLVDCGVDLVHIRKPSWTEEYTQKLIDEIALRCRNRLVVHKHHNPRSCHSLEEVVERKKIYDYVFLSPIFDSISKQGYRSAFTESELTEARNKGIIDERVVALGGVTLERIPRLRQFGFGGAALLGDVWQYSNNISLFASHIKELRKAML